MRFSILAVITASLGFAAANVSPLCGDIQGAFTIVTKQSSDANIFVSGLTPLTVFLQGGLVAQKFSTIINTVAEDVTMLSNGVTADMCTIPGSSKREAAPLELGKRSPPCVLGDHEGDIVVAALTDFVNVHKALLATVIGKGGLLASLPLFGSAVAEALRALESIVDEFALALIAVIPSSKHEAAQGQFDSLSIQVSLAIKKYSLITIN